MNRAVVLLLLLLLWGLLSVGARLSGHAPHNLTATVNSDGEVELAWEDTRASIIGFRVERRSGSSGIWNTTSFTVNQSEMTAVDPAPYAGITWYRVIGRRCCFTDRGSYARVGVFIPTPLQQVGTTVAEWATVAGRTGDVYWKENEPNPGTFYEVYGTGVGPFYVLGDDDLLNDVDIELDISASMVATAQGLTVRPVASDGTQGPTRGIGTTTYNHALVSTPGPPTNPEVDRGVNDITLSWGTALGSTGTTLLRLWTSPEEYVDLHMPNSLANSSVTLPRDHTLLDDDLQPENWPYFLQAQSILRGATANSAFSGEPPPDILPDRYLADGGRYTPARPSLTSEQRPGDTVGDVLLELDWTPIEAATGYEMELRERLDSGGYGSFTIASPPSECSSPEAGLLACGAGSSAAEISLSPTGLKFLRARVRASRYASSDHTLNVYGSNVFITGAATVYSEWSGWHDVAYRHAQWRTEDLTGTAPPSITDSGAGSITGARESIAVVREMLGFDDGSDDLLVSVVWLGVCLGLAMLAGGAGGVKAGSTGFAFGGAIFAVGWLSGPPLVGVPWGYALLPLALVMFLGLLMLRNRMG